MAEPQVDQIEELEQNVQVLEQILEVMPDDLHTMRALFEASLRLQQPEKAFETLQRLDDMSRSTGNLEIIDYVLAQYSQIAEDDPDIQSRMKRLEEARKILVPDAAPQEEAVVEVAVEPGGGRLDAEMALAWALYQDEQLTQEEYSNILHDLTEMSSSGMGVPVTVLHILHDRQFSRFERLMSHLSQKNNIPITVLSQFEDNEETARLLPVEFTCGNGVLPFAAIGDELLVAVLNPMDKELLAEAERLCGRKCHAYLVAPDEYDLMLERVKKQDD